MKTSWLTIILIVLQVVTAFSQDAMITFNRKNITLQELFNIIESNSDYHFFYNNDEVDVFRKIDINIEKKTVKRALEEIFKDLPYTFREFENKLFLIEPRPGKENKQENEIERAMMPAEVKGLVFDRQGKPLPGVTVIAEGFNAGTVTDSKGIFTLSVPIGTQNLIFSFLGMRTQHIEINNNTWFTITLTEEAIGIEEIVVIGYGSVKKSDLTGSVSIVTSNQLIKTPSGSFTRAMQGKASGVLITQPGAPGAEAQIRVRGIGSINQNSSPIYVIDGVITSGISNINPNDIETIQVLKDASATAIYGADGANGVIIITTRRGEKGRPKFNYSSYLSFNRVPSQFQLMNASEYSSFYSRLLTEYNVVVPVAYEDHFREWYYGEGWQEGTHWQQEITRPALGQNHNVMVSGGGDNSNYSISAGYFQEDGTLIASSATRFSLRANSDFSIGKHIKIGESLNLARLITQNPSQWNGNPWQISLVSSPLMRIYNPHNKGGFEGPQIPYEYQMPDGSNEIIVNTGLNDKVNPRGPLEMGDHMNYSNNLLASIFLEIKPFKWLMFRTMPSADIVFRRTKNWFPAFDLGVRSKNQAELFERFSELVSVSFENQLTYNNTWKGHNFTATAVHHTRISNENLVEATAHGFPYEQLRVISQSYEDGRQVQGAYNPFTSESYLGRILYDYQGKYLLTASLRRDGNSRFGPENRWGTFPSLSAGWKINEDLFSRVKQITLLKLRFGWGKTGNSSIGNFQYMSLIDVFSNFSPVFGIEQHMVPALNVIHSLGNPFIKWEAASMSNFGLDLNLFENKFQLSAEYYIKNQNDLLVRIPMSAAYGRVSGGGDPWVNLGELQNSGFEISGLYKKMEGNFNYNVSANFTTLKNRVKYIPGEIISGNNLTKNGHTTGSFYGYVAQRILTPNDFDSAGGYLHAMPATGVPSPGDLKFKDLNNDGIINDLDRTIIGKAIPDFTYSLNLEAIYKNIDLSVFLYGMQNLEIYNHLRTSIEGFSSQDLGHNKLKDYALNYYKPETPSDHYVRADINNTNQNDRPSTWYIEDGSFLRVKDIQLGYSFTGQFFRKQAFSHARIYLSATNALTFTSYKGRDPEAATIGDPINPGNDNGTYPVPRAFTAGIQIGF
jgi:TonB-dependent starch-binding outer membrane protein SusC